MHGDLHNLWDNSLATGQGILPPEVIVDDHVRVMQELQTRGLEHRPKGDLDTASIAKMEPQKNLRDVANLLTGKIVMKKPLLAIVGGMAVNGRGKDLDILINWPNPDDDFARRF